MFIYMMGTLFHLFTIVRKIKVLTDKGNFVKINGQFRKKFRLHVVCILYDTEWKVPIMGGKGG